MQGFNSNTANIVSRPVYGNRAVGNGLLNATKIDSSIVVTPVPPSQTWFYAALPNAGGWTGGGILGTYHSNNNFTGSTFTRTDVRVDFPPTTVLPGGSLSTDPVYGVVPATDFSASWVGTLIPRYTQTYTLKIKGSASLTLSINGVNLATATTSSDWVSVPYNFTAGQSYPVTLTLSTSTGPWGAQFHWLSAGPNPFPEEAVGPATPIGVNFSDNTNSTANGSYIGEYYATVDTGVGPAVDSKGWPTGDFAFSRMSTTDYGTGPYNFPNPLRCNTNTGVWTITFDGAAEIYTNGRAQFLLGHDDGQGRTLIVLNGKNYYSYSNDLQAGSLVYDVGTGTGYQSDTNTTVVLFLLTATGPSQYPNVGFRNTDRSGIGAPGKPGTPAHNGLTNVSLMKPTYVGSTISYPPGTLFLAPYLATATPYTALRDTGQSYNIDYNASHTSPYSDWEKRSTPVLSYQASDTNQFPINRVAAWEHKVMLANQTGKDLYVNIPQTASGGDPQFDSNYQSSYLYQLASLLKSGITINGISYPGLLPHLNVYLEYGNENWNFSLTGPYGARGNVKQDIFTSKDANTLTYQQYVALGGWTSYNPDGSPKDALCTLWGVLRAKNISDIFRTVYGDAAMPGGPGGVNPDPRVRPIFEWQYGDGWNGEGYAAYTGFHAIESYFGVQINKVLWGGGGAWYSDNNTVGTNADQVFGNISLANVKPPGPGDGTNSIQPDMNTLAQFGLHHVGYEGGFDFGDGQNHCTDGQQQAHNDVRVKPYIRQTVDQYFQSGGSLAVAMIQTGGNYGYGLEWAIIDTIWSTPPYYPAPPKLQAYLDAQNVVSATPTYGLVVPSTSFYNPYGWSNGARPQQTFLVTTAGTYKIGFLVSHDNTYATGTIQALIDGVVVGSLTTLDSNGGQSLWVPVQLGAGIHGAALVFSNENPNNTQIALSYWGVTL